MKSIIFIFCLLFTSCVSHQEAIENADAWNSMVIGLLTLVTCLCAFFLLALGVTAIKEWLKSQ